jgi:hypothetical protein
LQGECISSVVRSDSLGRLAQQHHNLVAESGFRIGA